MFDAMEIEFKSKGDRDTLNNVDPLSAMAFASAFLVALQEEAKALGRELKFEGFHLKPGSVIVVTKPSNDALARQVERLVKNALSSGRVRSKPHLQRLVRTSEETSFLLATTTHGKRRTKFDFSTILAAEEPRRTELTTMRVVFLGIEARNAVSAARARFQSVLTPETLRLVVEKMELEQKLIASFRQEFDIDVELERDVATGELTGKLLGAELVKSGDALAEWKDWFAEAGSGWKGVTPAQYDAERQDEEKP